MRQGDGAVRRVEGMRARGTDEVLDQGFRVREPPAGLQFGLPAELVSRELDDGERKGCLHGVRERLPDNQGIPPVSVFVIVELGGWWHLCGLKRLSSQPY